MALPFESHRLALTPGLVAQVFGDRVDQAMLEGSGGQGGAEGAHYRRLEGEEGWWVPGGRVFYSPDTLDDPAAELAHARAHFYLPQRSRDPFFVEGRDREARYSPWPPCTLAHARVILLLNMQT